MNKLITIRSATEDDQPIIRRLIIEGRINPTRLKWTKFIVAENDAGKVVGCGQIKPHRDGSLELASIAVTSAWQKQGIAKKLILHLMQNFEDQPLYLVCRANLENFYTPFGFVALSEAELPKYFRKLIKLTGFLETVGKLEERALFMGRNVG